MVRLVSRNTDTFCPPQLLYNAMKRNLQKKSKEKHRMLFTRMGRSDSFYPGVEEADTF